MQCILFGMSLSVLAMLAAMAGWLAPVPAALLQEAIDLAVILNALRASRPPWSRARRTIPATARQDLHGRHVSLTRSLDRLRSIADELDDAPPDRVMVLIPEANSIVQQEIVAHERNDESVVYPELAKVLADRRALSAMGRAHREILHLARLLARIAEDLPSEKIDRYITRDAQRVM